MTIEQNSNSLYYPRTYLLAMGFCLGLYGTSHEIPSCEKASDSWLLHINSATIFLAFIFNPVFLVLIVLYTSLSVEPKINLNTQSQENFQSFADGLICGLRDNNKNWFFCNSWHRVPTLGFIQDRLYLHCP